MQPVTGDTAAQLRTAANQRNAQHSTGPRTLEGKSKIRFNALQHGLYSQAVVLPTENADSFQHLGRILADRYQPRNEDEQKLVQTLHETEWRLSRIITLESGILAIGAAENLDGITRRFPESDEDTCNALAQAAGYLANSRMLDQLSRHEARLRRLRQTTLAGLEEIGVKRAGAPESGFVPHDILLSESDPLPEPVSAPESGFVPTDIPAVLEITTQKLPKMPKFSGPNRKQDRKNWLRVQARKAEAHA